MQWPWVKKQRTGLLNRHPFERKSLSINAKGRQSRSTGFARDFEKLLEKCERPALAIDCSHNKYYTYCDGQSLKVDFEF